MHTYTKNFSKLAAAIGILAVLAPSLAAAQVDPMFDPNKLIDDAVFVDTKTFGGAAGIQKFLELKGSVLARTDTPFLLMLQEPTDAALKTKLEDPQPNLGRLRTAAELIWDASIQSGLNPQVIVVKLNKEQGLITSSATLSGDSLQRALNFSLGFGCPDGGGCSGIFKGFYSQVFGNVDAEGNRYLGAAKSLMKSYATPGGRGPNNSKVGDVITIENTTGEPNNAAPSQIVTLSNRATAALYRYTPHVFNGNYNFWRFFQAWFKYPNGTIFAVSGALDAYIVQNGSKQLLPNFVANARGLNLAGKIAVSPTEFDAYPTGPTYAPLDGTVAVIPGEVIRYVFLDGKRRPASEFVIKQRGLASGTPVNVTQAELALFEAAPQLTPKDGTVLRGTTNTATYLVENTKLRPFSAFTFKQKKITAKQVVTLPDAEVASYEVGAFVVPNDGTLVKADNDTAVYYVEQGLRRPVTAELFKNRGFSFKNVATLSAGEVTAMNIGSYVEPKDRTFFASGSKTGQQYIFKSGSKHSISPAVAKQRGISPDYVIAADVVAGWVDGLPIPPKDGTTVKGDTDGTVYYVQGGQLRPLTSAAFKRLKIQAKNIMVLSQAEVDSYGKGDTLEK